MLTQWSKTKSLYFREQLMPSEEKNENSGLAFQPHRSRADFTHAEQHLDLVGNGWTGSNLMDPKRTSAKAFCMRLATQMLRVMKKKHTSCIQLRRDCADNALSVDHKTWPAVVIMAHEIGLPFLRPCLLWEAIIVFSSNLMQLGLQHISTAQWICQTSQTHSSFCAWFLHFATSSATTWQMEDGGDALMIKWMGTA